MKILAIADTESKALWDYFDKSMLEGIDVILSCGDLHPHYLSFLATFTSAPVLYVRGNHDDRYVRVPPEGCICIEDLVYEYKGIRFAGLGGAMRYKPGANMYTEKEMKRRAKKMRSQMRKRGGFDILVTHAPAQGLNDGDDMPHKGFKTFLTLLDKFQPALFVHGHVHATYGGRYKRESAYRETRVVNAYEKYIIELDEEPIIQKKGRMAPSLLDRILKR